MNKQEADNNGAGGNRLAFEAAHDNTELANTLLSLGAKYTLPHVLESSFKDPNPYRKPEYLPLAVTAPPTYGLPNQPPVSLPQTNAWMGGSPAALVGYPYSSLGIDPVSFCSCATRVAPSYPGWKSYQQSTMPGYTTVSSAIPQNQGLCYPQPLHHPLIFAPNGLQSNLQGYNSVESRTGLGVPLQQQQHQQHQQHPPHTDQQVPVGLPQPLLTSKPLKINADLSSPPQCIKQDSPRRSPVAVVAPLILEFNQKNPVQGIPLIYNVNQWLNVPSCDGDQQPSSKSENWMPRNCPSRDAPVLHSCVKAQQKHDPISQLGEAANMILQCDESKKFVQQKSANMCIKANHFNSCSVSPGDPIQQVVSQDSGHLTHPSIVPSHAIGDANPPKNLKNRTCPYCQKIFARPFTLKSHIRRHTKEKPYECKVCQRSFSQSATLENHKLTHTGAKPHQCNVCLKRFAHQTSLKTHLRIHSGEQPYACDFCARRFTDGSTLQKHKRIHSGDKPFSCRFCLKCFSQSGNMRRHMTTTHKEAILSEEASKGNVENSNHLPANSPLLNNNGSE